MEKSLAELSSVLMVMNPSRVCKAREWSGLKISIPRCLMSDLVEYGNGGRCELIKEPLQLYGEKELGKARHLGLSNESFSSARVASRLLLRIK